jgi:hypothetical protein
VLRKSKQSPFDERVRINRKVAHDAKKPSAKLFIHNAPRTDNNAPWTDNCIFVRSEDKNYEGVHKDAYAVHKSAGPG